MTDYNELKKLAEAATPGEWKLHHVVAQPYITTLTDGSHYDKDYFAVTAQDENDENGGCICDNGQYYACTVAEKNIRFIAAANPATVLQMIARIAELEQRVAELEPIKAAVLSVIDGDQPQRSKQKFGKCDHEKYKWEECENCITDYLQSAIAKSSSKEAE